ncbi:S9 family peptidase [Ahniella affigens]|uniref:S9 family peptidase n=2 Tax=Ahniella affigens TaxID=2021234 RepID=A0A2P1PYU6_9GAMM|nr:prolyl oligopeptidase family serine peptidase [Ahniella affigens]AVQ00007.1 S9 family peptidase [Ahniella affigens]
MASAAANEPKTTLISDQEVDSNVASDPNLWLEDVTGDRALDWVRAQNATTVKALAESDSFKKTEARIRAILDSDARIPDVGKMGPHYYNFWRDASHPRGIWRRTSLAEYRKPQPKWDVLLDLDALGKAEQVNWVWSGFDCLAPAYERCLLLLSKGGADATVVREFDLTTRRFVKDGFDLPEAKTSIGWRDLDSVYVGTDFGPGSMTSSGYPRVTKLWKRGTSIKDAKTIFEGDADDVWVYAGRDHRKGYERDVVLRGMTFFTNQAFSLKDGELSKIDKPDSADASTWRDWLLLSLRDDWKVGAKTWPKGALLAAKFDDFMAGKRDLHLLYEPGPRKSLAGFSGTKHHILVNELDMVRNKVYVLTPKDGTWQRQPLVGAPDLGTVGVGAVDPDDSDAYFMTVTDYLTPTSLYLGEVGADKPELLKSLPAFFNAGDFAVKQHLAKSDDGTEVPYFVVYRNGLKLDGSHPTLLYGYGGFEVSEVPSYRAGVGTAWLERGGVYAVANIRGGGEFGPSWHQAALKEHRHKAYEDMAAVAKDLATRGYTSAKQLGVVGGSNGGLLTGNMLSTYPDLFGAVVIQVPLLDMLRYHKLLAGASWMGEYGDPDNPEEAVFLRRYSPYHQLQADKHYPPVLLTTSTRDDRVHPGHARKMMAKLMAQGHTAYYYENTEGGHGGGADNQQLAFMSTLAYEFLWQTLAKP